MSTTPEVNLPVGTRVVGDMHLDVEQPSAVAAFVDWLDALGTCPRLIILGDLFEYWIGMAQAESTGGAAILAALRRRAEAGTALDVLWGNRDFCLDARFERRSAAVVRPAGLVGRLPGGGRVLCLHGDELCVHDVAYQRLRRVLRSRPLTWLAPRLPAALSRALARRLRRASTAAVAAKSAPEKAQDPAAAARALGEHGAETLIVGHAHRFRDEELDGGGRWLVVDGFGGPRDQILVGPDGRLVAGSSGAKYRPPPETVV